jgi:hypothetical protein
MWKYIFASSLLFVGIVEIVLAFNERLREALMQSSPVRSKLAERPALLFAGVSAIIMGLGILFYGLVM